MAVFFRAKILPKRLSRFQKQQNTCDSAGGGQEEEEGPSVNKLGVGTLFSAQETVLQSCTALSDVLMMWLVVSRNLVLLLQPMYLKKVILVYLFASYQMYVIHGGC